MPIKVPCHPLNFGTAFAIFINVVSRYSKLNMCYRMRPLTAPPAENCGVSFRISKTLRDRGKK